MEKRKLIAIFLTIILLTVLVLVAIVVPVVLNSFESNQNDVSPTNPAKGVNIKTTTNGQITDRSSVLDLDNGSDSSSSTTTTYSSATAHPPTTTKQSTGWAQCAMGMKSGDIKDNAITASSENGRNHGAPVGRLDAKDERFTAISTNWGNNIGAWCTRNANGVGDWIQIDLVSVMSVGGVVTQGRAKNKFNDKHWVKTYKVSCGESTRDMEFIQENGSDKVFKGNNDNESKVVSMFPTAMNCRYVRIYPQSYNDHTCMRLELLRGGCKV